MKLLFRMAVTALVAVGLATAAAPAYADPSPGPGAAGLDAAKRTVTARIDGRLAALRAYNTVLGAVQRLDAGHKATLSGLVQADQSGLTALRGKVAGETTLAAVKADDQSMVNDYRIYLLVGPKVRLTVAADLETAASHELRQAADKLASAIAAAKQAGKDIGNADADLADLRSQVDAADAALGGKGDALLAIQPGPDADAIKNQISPVRDAVKSARADLHKAATDARSIRTALGG